MYTRYVSTQSRRTSIYLTADLASRLERVKERINVSQVCQEALLVAVEAHERSLADRRAEIVQRLHAAQDEFSYAFHRGTAAGREWAAEHATWPELVTVAQWGVIAHPDQLTRKRPMPELGYRVVTGIELRLPPPPGPLYVPRSVTAEPPTSSDEAVVLFWGGFRDGAKEVYKLVSSDFKPADEKSEDGE